MDVSCDQRVQPALCPERIRDALVGGQDSGTRDRPVGDATQAQIIEVDRLMGTVEAPHPDVHDAGPQGGAVVPGHRHPWVQLLQGRRRELGHRSASIVGVHERKRKPT